MYSGPVQSICLWFKHGFKLWIWVGTLFWPGRKVKVVLIAFSETTKGYLLFTREQRFLLQTRLCRETLQDVLGTSFRTAPCRHAELHCSQQNTCLRPLMVISLLLLTETGLEKAGSPNSKGCMSRLGSTSLGGFQTRRPQSGSSADRAYGARGQREVSFHGQP